jgi:uncharacterized protein (TIGR02246 family)
MIGPMTAAAETRQEVIAAMNDWAAAYDRKDPAAYAAAFADDADVILLGTGADEIAVGRDAIRDMIQSDFEEAEQVRVELGEVRVSAAGDVAWAVMPDVIVDVTVGGQQQSIPLRITTVFRRTDGRWLIQHAHVSAPMAGQEAGHSFPAPAT